MKNIIYVALLMWSVCAVNAHAQTSVPQSNSPVTVTADTALEWDRVNKLFTARGNAVATQDDVSIASEILTASYVDGADGKGFDIQQFEAQQNVVLTSADNVAYGDHAFYYLKRGYAILTGQNLKLQTPEQVITARDKFEYFVDDGRLIAVGNAVVTRPQDQLRGDTITATMTNDAQGKRVIKQVVAQGNVVITTQQERVTGQHGVYDAQKELVTLDGGVTIMRGPNILRGQSAVVDLKTQISKLYGAEQTGAGQGRVTGTFYPGSEKGAADK